MRNNSIVPGGLRAVLLFCVLSGCASTGDYADTRDPFEGLNRSIYAFNEKLDDVLIAPLARGYKKVTPAPVDKGVTNFFNNLFDVTSAVNNLLQFKLQRAANDVGRLMVNTTLGIGGLFDVASNMNMQRYGEDFGQTLGVWGVGPGPYIVLPILGPSSGRGVVGKVGDWFTNPVTYIESERWRYGLIALEKLDTRADLLGASRVVEEAALDPYEFTKDVYFQKRQFDVYDGNPPLETEEDEFFDDEFEDDEFEEDEFQNNKNQPQ